jgi:hypothetical protein
MKGGLLAQSGNDAGTQAPTRRGSCIAAEGGKADIAKPMHGMGSGVFEIALAFKDDAFRVVYRAATR